MCVAAKRMNIMITEITEPTEKRRISTAILSSLPDWFGLPDSTREYIDKSAEMPFFSAMDEEMVVGFAALRLTSPHTAEVYVMGVLPKFHRSGIGRELYSAVEMRAREIGCSYMQVKTVQMGRYPEYDRTNRFYLAMGFSELECFPTLWDEWNPCQVYVKYIR